MFVVAFGAVGGVADGGELLFDVVRGMSLC